MNLQSISVFTAAEEWEEHIEGKNNHKISPEGKGILAFSYTDATTGESKTEEFIVKGHSK